MGVGLANLAAANRTAVHTTISNIFVLYRRKKANSTEATFQSSHVTGCPLYVETFVEKPAHVVGRNRPHLATLETGARAAAADFRGMAPKWRANWRVVGLRARFVVACRRLWRAQNDQSHQENQNKDYSGRSEQHFVCCWGGFFSDLVTLLW